MQFAGFESKLWIACHWLFANFQSRSPYLIRYCQQSKKFTAFLGSKKVLSIERISCGKFCILSHWTEIARTYVFFFIHDHDHKMAQKENLWWFQFDDYIKKHIVIVDVILCIMQSNFIITTYEYFIKMFQTTKLEFKTYEHCT